MKDLIIFILIIYILFEISNLKNIRENFDAATDAAITTSVKKIYLADVEAIRLLSNFAIQLSQGGTTIPGDVKITGQLASLGKDPNDRPSGWGGGFRTLDVYADGTVAAGTNKGINAYLNSGGNIYSLNGLRLGGGGGGGDQTNNGIFSGNGDNATTDINNVYINSWFGVGFRDTCYKKTNIWFDLRTGTINCKAINITG